MATVNESIVREYFETLGYLVRQPSKHTATGRQKKAAEEVDLVILNPTLTRHEIPANLVWHTKDLATVARAVIAIRGWHTERFYASTFEQTPDILRFAQPDSVKFATRILGTADFAKVLCLPRLPASGELKEQTIALLREKGLDGVISFKTMLSELVARVETQNNYDKSDLLQVIRLLKNYDLLREPQMELFGKKRRRKA